jgi:4-amino-4-deoxy-L-arabinose transferase-like glycosyltransferase
MIDNRPGEKEKKAWILLIVSCLLLYLCGWTIPLMEIDAAQYANISREMLLHRHYIQLYDRGSDYLDKPPMLFWLSALSMHFFGINDIAYRLPSFLFAILSIYSTYRLALLFYTERIALLSALVLSSCQAMILITHDVRTDTMLMGWVIFGIWQMAIWYRRGGWIHLLLCSLAIAGGMMTKGPIALMVPVFAFSSHFLLQRAYRQFFRWQYLLMLLVIGLLLLPMSVGLYQQYDLHPEKVMYGQKGISGLRFFFWTQSFGRVTGESTWHENDSFFFLFQNMLWGFLPWTLFFVGALISAIRALIKKRFLISAEEEGISTGGFLLTYCALASSRFQLPHYLYVVFPLAAIVTAIWLHKLLYTDVLGRLLRPLIVFQSLVIFLLSLGLFALLLFPFPQSDRKLLPAAFLVFIFLILVIQKRWIPLPSLLILSVLGILFINIFLDLGFYRPLLQYQVSIKVSSIIKKEKLSADRFYIFKMAEERSLHFYSNHRFSQINRLDSLKPQDCTLTSEEGMDSIENSMNKNQFRILYKGEGFHVSTLTLNFLNPATREKETKPYYILQRM